MFYARSAYSGCCRERDHSFRSIALSPLCVVGHAESCSRGFQRIRASRCHSSFVEIVHCERGEPNPCARRILLAGGLLRPHRSKPRGIPSDRSLRGGESFERRTTRLALGPCVFRAFSVAGRDGRRLRAGRPLSAAESLAFRVRSVLPMRKLFVLLF